MSLVSLRPEPADTEPTPAADAEPAVRGEPAAFEEAEAVAVEAPEAALASEQAAETEEEVVEATDLPIHLWVQAPGANGMDADPEWPQELVRLGLERSRRAREPDRDDQY